MEDKTREAIIFLKKMLGLQLLEIILNVDSRTINKWLKDELHPSDRQEVTIRFTRNIIEILLDYLTVVDTKDWLVTHSDYLYGIPAVEISRRPEEVRYAALNRAARGEMYG